MIFKNLFRSGLLLVCLNCLVSCSDDQEEIAPNPEQDTYNTAVYITDAPIDNANVEAAFITVTGVVINGKELEGFEKTTIEISSLQNGESQLLGEVDLESGTTSDITLQLDNDTDASGETPGSYVLTADGQKNALATGSAEININDDAEIGAASDNELIIDFDLRKAIISDDEEGGYKFVGAADLSNSVRAVNNLNAGTITGTVENLGDAETLVVYTFEAGAYSESETEDFTNSVSSSLVSESNGDFSLHFLEAGDYELHFASYSDSDGDGQLEFEGMLESSAATDQNLSEVSVSAESETSVEVTLEGLLNL